MNLKLKMSIFSFNFKKNNKQIKSKMLREICNPLHANQVTHIDTLTDTLVCPNDKYNYESAGSRLIPIIDYATSSADVLRQINRDTQSLLSKLESRMNIKTLKNPIIQKIEQTFEKFIAEIESIKNGLIARISTNTRNLDSSIATEFCAFAEEVSVANINLKKALINKDNLEIRKSSLKKTITELNHKYQYYLQTLFN